MTKKEEHALNIMHMEMQKHGFAQTGKGMMTMPDREKVIKGLECCTSGYGCVSDCPYFKEVPMTDGRCIMATQADALALLKEREPMKPTWSQGKAYCGKCGQKLPRKREDKEINYCGCCGQEVKWE